MTSPQRNTTPADGPFSPATLGPLTLRNRLIKCATFEGMTPDALVTDDLIEFHREVAAGGVAMSTVAYCAIAPEGRTDRHQIWPCLGCDDSPMPYTQKVPSPPLSSDTPVRWRTRSRIGPRPLGRHAFRRRWGCR